VTGGEVRLVDLVKRFDDVVAVDHLDLDIEGGEFFSLLGPSGCGKTTTLRLIAGFERPTRGSILLDGVDMAQTPPHKRKVNTVFQNYALFPHLDVFENVAFGLVYRDVPKSGMQEIVQEALVRVRMDGMEHRRPSQLSGGQQQRVALARALVLDPEVLLLDEPLGALDAKLRKALQVELKALQETVGITFIYVTHDQEEALTMSDRLAVMSNGRIQQIGAPEEVYQEPVSAWVADFLGVSNLMDADAVGPDGRECRVRVGDFELRAAAGDLDATGRVKIVVRPERVVLEPHGTTGVNRMPAMVERTVYVGPVTQLMVRLAAGDLIQVMVPNRGDEQEWRQGTAVTANLPPEALRVLRVTDGDDAVGDEDELVPLTDGNGSSPAAVPESST
jgi:spermidine/putrescine transport system ATP-binding protein